MTTTIPIRSFPMRTVVPTATRHTPYTTPRHNIPQQQRHNNRQHPCAILRPPKPAAHHHQQLPPTYHETVLGDQNQQQQKKTTTREWHFEWRQQQWWWWCRLPLQCRPLECSNEQHHTGNFKYVAPRSSVRKVWSCRNGTRSDEPSPWQHFHCCLGSHLWNICFHAKVAFQNKPKAKGTTFETRNVSTTRLKAIFSNFFVFFIFFTLQTNAASSLNCDLSQMMYFEVVMSKNQILTYTLLLLLQKAKMWTRTFDGADAFFWWPRCSTECPFCLQFDHHHPLLHSCKEGDDLLYRRHHHLVVLVVLLFFFVLPPRAFVLVHRLSHHYHDFDTILGDAVPPKPSPFEVPLWTGCPLGKATQISANCSNQLDEAACNVVRMDKLTIQMDTKFPQAGPTEPC